MNRLPILASAAAAAMLFAQSAFAAGCKAPGGWGPYGVFGPAAKPHSFHYRMPHHRGPWTKPAYRPGVHHRMVPPGWHAGRMAPPAANAGTAAAAMAAPAAATQAAAPADSAAVRVSQMRFGPSRVVVAKGATVTWSFEDGMPHTVTAVDGSFDSGRLSAGGQFSHTFDQPGTFAYYCTLHPSMRGEVVVVE